MRPIIMKLWIFLAVLAIAGCSGDFAPTGAKGLVDAFGRSLYMDEECGALADPDYPDFYANALLRDGDIGRGRMWLVDGSHLWSLPMESEDLPVMQLERAFVGHGNAVAAGPNLLALALVDRGVLLFPDYDIDTPISLGSTRAIDVAIHGDLLAVADGGEGIRVYDISDPWWPQPVTAIAVPGYASGVRWQAAGERQDLYYSACSHVGRITFEENLPIRQQHSDRLAHANAKDAHGDGTWLVAANNGAGVWFATLSDLDAWTRYDISDPNFYANSVQVVEDMAYVAAGNREILALRVDYPEHLTPPPPPFSRDPLGILVVDDMVYGFGNFRDVGERTVVRTPAISTQADEALFAQGMTPWTEPVPYAELTTLYAGMPTGVVERMYFWTRDGGRVFESALTDAVWRLLPDLHYYGQVGPYTVEVRNQGYVRAYAPGATEAIAVGGLVLGSGFVRSFGDYLLVAPAAGPVATFRDDATLGWAYLELEGHSAGHPYDWIQGPEFPVNALPFHDLASCEFPTTQEEGGRSRAVRLGAEGSVDGEYTWCTRMVDPHLAGRRPENDYGTHVHEADTVLSLWESGIVGLLRTEDGWLGLVDDRRAFTASIVRWDGKGREVRRYSRMGKPLGWRWSDAGQIRAWLADGTTFTLDIEDWRTFDEVRPFGGQE